MDQIMWDGSGWKPVSMGDLLVNGAVKKKTMLAKMKTHPDRTSKLPHEARFIAKRVFDALNQAYDEYIEQGGQ